jgi:hypothetical protein
MPLRNFNLLPVVVAPCDTTKKHKLCISMEHHKNSHWTQKYVYYWRRFLTFMITSKRIGTIFQRNLEMNIKLGVFWGTMISPEENILFQ